MTIKKITRREFLERFGLDAIFLYGAFDTRWVGLLYGSRKKEIARKARTEEKPVAKFSEDILVASEKLEDVLYKIAPDPFSSLCIGAVVGNELKHIEKTRKSKLVRIGSVFGMVSDRLLDHYSTYRLAVMMQDPRFTEYGFNRFVYELNPNLDPYPKPSDLISASSIALDVLFSTISYPLLFVGYSFGIGGAGSVFTSQKA